MPRMTQAELDAYTCRRKNYILEPSSDVVDRESDLHDEVLRLCRDRGYYPIHSRMDRPTTCGVGTPDFVILLPGGRTVSIELKAKGGKLRPEQQAAGVQIQHLGHRWTVAYSMADVHRILDGRQG